MNARKVMRTGLLGVLLVCANSSAQPKQSAEIDLSGQELHILTWSDYLDQDLVRNFSERFKVKVKFTYFETDEHRDQLLAVQGAKAYDLALVDITKLSIYKKQGWLTEFDERQIPNLGHLDPRCSTGSEARAKFAIPYFWGTMGIAYRSDLVPNPVTRWMELYRPPVHLRGKMVMIADARELLGMAAKALGRSLNSEDGSAWEAAGQLALAQKPFVHSYGYVAIDENSGLVSGKILAAQIYNGEALVLQAHNKDITYVHPAEGSSYWVDYWTLFSQAPNPALAHVFLNYLNEPENAAANAQSIYFATCNKGAQSLLPMDFLEDPIIYPPPEVMKRLEPYEILSPRSSRKLNMLYSQIVKARN